MVVCAGMGKYNHLLVIKYTSTTYTHWLLDVTVSGSGTLTYGNQKVRSNHTDMVGSRLLISSYVPLCLCLQRCTILDRVFSNSVCRELGGIIKIRTGTITYTLLRTMVRGFVRF